MAKSSIAETMAALLPLVVEATGAEVAAVRVLGDSLEQQTFSTSAALDPTDPAAGDLEHPLDVSGHPFGVALLRFSNQAEKNEAAPELLEAWCEVVDNHLAALVQARVKQQVLEATVRALQEPVLEHGLDRALLALTKSFTGHALVLVFRPEDAMLDAQLFVRCLRDGRLVDATENKALTEQGAALLTGEPLVLQQILGQERFSEEVLISGVRRPQVLGRLFVLGPPLDWVQRDLLTSFADSLRQRIGDFNREWKQLSRSFAPAVTRRLLAEPDYRERYLVPREREVAILYCDISGFTALSERVLGTPTVIGQVIDVWSRQVVDVVWEEGGVFDKMVGDCVIALWGPPFFEARPQEACQAAARAALRIRKLTRDLPEKVAALAGVTLGVAQGLNFCSLGVGLFGPDECYTGFSAGMNNTARLQAVARRDEILCMESFVEAYGDLAAFGPPGHATVKNVLEPLQFRPLQKA